MAVTLTSTGITFPDSTTSTTKETKLGAVQIGGNYVTTGYGNWPTSPIAGIMLWAYNYTTNGTVVTAGPDSATTVFCGWDVYRYGSFYNTTYSSDSGADGPADTSQIYVRAVYRVVG